MEERDSGDIIVLLVAIEIREKEDYQVGEPLIDLSDFVLFRAIV